MNELLERMRKSPHILIAGATGSGKSVLINSYLYSLRDEFNIFYYIDLKRIELAKYKNTIGTGGYAVEFDQAVELLDEVLELMNQRYANMKGRRSDDTPVYVIVDELADLSRSKACIEKLTRIGRLGRAANIKMLCATQDPSRSTLPAHLVQNFTCRVALRCMSPIESRQIIGENGAEMLPRYGRCIIRDAEGIDELEVPMTSEDDIDDYVSENHYDYDGYIHKQEIMDKVREMLPVILSMLCTATLFTIKFAFKALLLFLKVSHNMFWFTVGMGFAPKATLRSIKRRK